VNRRGDVDIEEEESRHTVACPTPPCPGPSYRAPPSLQPLSPSEPCTQSSPCSGSEPANQLTSVSTFRDLTSPTFLLPPVLLLLPVQLDRRFDQLPLLLGQLFRLGLCRGLTFRRSVTSVRVVEDRWLPRDRHSAWHAAWRFPSLIIRPEGRVREEARAKTAMLTLSAG
jgi:hypothetical protein